MKHQMHYDSLRRCLVEVRGHRYGAAFLWCCKRRFWMVWRLILSRFIRMVCPRPK